MQRFTVLFALIATTVACDEAEQLAEQLQGSADESSPTDASTETLPSETDERPDLVNPFAYVGEAHNLYLDCTTDHLELVRGDTLVEEAAAVMKVLEGQCGYPSGPELQIASDIELVEEGLHGTGIAMGLGDAELDILAMADRIVRTYEPQEALLQLGLLEKDALHELGDESVGVLAALATAQASGAYWDQDEPTGDEPSRAKWWQIVLADAAGALVGSLAGPQGTITLGVTASTLVAK